MFRFLFLICWLMTCAAFAQNPQDEPNIDHTRLMYGHDTNIKIVMKGRAGNLELKAAPDDAGYSEVDYQQGSGYVAFDREKQLFRWVAKIPYTLNRLSKNIMRKAPYMRAFIPNQAELDFNLDISSLGYATLDFENLNLQRFRLDVNYGDVDVDFPSLNQSIFRGTARFRLLAGDLELENLGNLKAGEFRINGGAGELSVDFGPRLYLDTEVSLDHDMGTLDLTFPKGTHVVIDGTTRDLSAYGFEKLDKAWRPISYSENSPTLAIHMKGPLGNLNVTWE